MKKIVIILCAVLFIMSAFSSHYHFKSGIQGTIDPPEGAKKVWAISGTDSIPGEIMMGKFTVNVKPGNWKLFVEAVQPYKNTVVENILVQESEVTDAGIIKLPA